MKNFKKLLVTMLALVLLICGATVVSFAADTPAEIIADARVLLDQATEDGEFIAVRAQKMRELDKLIDNNMSAIRNSQEWRDFQIGYYAAQEQLEKDCVAEATASLDALVDRDLSANEASALFSGLSTLISKSGDARGYFDIASAEFEALSVRLKVAEVIAKLQVAEDSAIAKNVGASLLWGNDYKTTVLDVDAACTALPEYALIGGWFDELFAGCVDELYAEIAALAAEAMNPATSLERAQALCATIDEYFAGCYFKTDTAIHIANRKDANLAILVAYVNEIERTDDLMLLLQGKNLRVLSELSTGANLNTSSEAYLAFDAAYKAMTDATDETSVAGRLCALAEGYMKDVADVFVEGYDGPLTDAKALAAVADELESLVMNCYFAGKEYSANAAVTRAYAEIFNFYVAMQKIEEQADSFVYRNGLYKKAVTSFTNLSLQMGGARESYHAAFKAIYDKLCEDAAYEMTLLLNGWRKSVDNCEIREEDGSYRVPLGEVRTAYRYLMDYYLGKDPLYFGATENKTLTANIKAGCGKAEGRILTELNALLAEAKNLVEIPADLATIDPDGLAAKTEMLGDLFVSSGGSTGGIVFTFADQAAFDEYYSNLLVEMYLCNLAYAEISYASGDKEASFTQYKRLKEFMASNATKVNIESESYLLFAGYLNKIEVRMGEGNVPGARELLEKLLLVIDNDNFDKVYALMHLDEFIRKNSITRPDASDTTSVSALFYKDYDAAVAKVAAWRQAIVDEREKSVPISDYNSTAVNFYDMDEKQTSAQKYDHTFTQKDNREHGANGSQYYATFEYTKGSSSDGYIAATLPSSTANVVIEMDITTFTTWPTGGVSFNSGANGLETGKRIYPWLGAINAAGQIVAPNGKSHGAGPTLTNREGGYIIPGQWTHFAIVYNAQEKMVSYYVNDEKIVDANGNDRWSCKNQESFNFTEALRIGNANSGGGSFSVDNVALYVGNQPRNIHLFEDMSAVKKFAYYVDYVKSYIDKGAGKASDAKACYDELVAIHALYYGVKNEGDTEKTYLFDENTYWADGADPGITYDELVAAVNNYLYIETRADDVIGGAVLDGIFEDLKTSIENIQALSGIANLAKRKAAIAEFDAYVEANLSSIAMFNDTQKAAYEGFQQTKEQILLEVDAYDRVNDYIEAVNKMAAAKDLYSRTVHRATALSIMASMEADAALGYFDLVALKIDITEFSAAILLFEEQSALLDIAVIKDNNGIIIDCMSRFPATAEEAMKNYSYLNKYIVLVRRLIAEGNYDATDLGVQEALAVYEKMNATFYEALQLDHAATVQELIDQFNSETAYITRLGIYYATKNYLEENASTIDMTHDSIKGIYSQFEIMEQRFGTEQGKEEQWKEYGEILEANTLKFLNLITQMRFSKSYAELVSLREQAALLFYFMDSSSAEAKRAVEFYQSCEVQIAQNAILGERFIETAYALKKASGMADTYRALLVAKAAFEVADVTYDGYLSFTEKRGEETYTVTFTMKEAVEAYQIALSQYNSFVTVVNNEVSEVLDVVCSVRVSFPVNQPVVALFKKYYD